MFRAPASPSLDDADGRPRRSPLAWAVRRLEARNARGR